MNCASRHRVRHVVAAAIVALLVSGCSANGAEPPPRPRAKPTGQFDQATILTGQLRDDLLAASKGVVKAKAPDPAHPITLRSSLRPTGAKTRVLLLSFQSRAGQPCVGVTVYRPGAIPDPPGCVRPCRRFVCVELLLGGPLPRGVVVLAGLADPTVDEIAIIDLAGRITRYHVSDRRFGRPPATPVLVRVGKIQSVIALVAGERVQEVRFPRLVFG